MGLLKGDDFGWSGAVERGATAIHFLCKGSDTAGRRLVDAGVVPILADFVCNEDESTEGNKVNAKARSVFALRSLFRCR